MIDKDFSGVFRHLGKEKEISSKCYRALKRLTPRHTCAKSVQPCVEGQLLGNNLFVPAHIIVSQGIHIKYDSLRPHILSLAHLFCETQLEVAEQARNSYPEKTITLRFWQHVVL